MNTADLHDELVAALTTAGGVDPNTLLPSDYKGKRSDVAFATQLLQVEVKSLAEDQVAIDSISRRVNPIFRRWARQGGPVAFGTVLIPWDKMPERMRHEVENALAPRIEKNLKDANRQFRETKHGLGWNASFNAVAIIAPNTFKLDPGIIGRVAWNQLHRREGNLPEIDLVMSITAQVLDQPNSVNLPMAVISFPRRNEPRAYEVGRVLREAWARHFSVKTGVRLIERNPSDEAFFKEFKLVEIGAPRTRPSA